MRSRRRNGSARSSQPGADLLGRYLVRDCAYHSFVEEPDDDAPEGMLGWREVTMVPADENWEAIDALART